MNQQRQGVGSRSVKTVLRQKSATKRAPLLDLDINRSPTKLTKSPSKVAFKEIQAGNVGTISTAEKRDMEDWSFSNVDILAGTPGFGLAVKDQMDYLEEESTADL